MHHHDAMILSTCQPCVPGAVRGGLVRTRFYDGMFLTQADLENEQVYWRMKRRLTNRALGQGIVWGLRLDIDQSERVRLSPGYALDCCGNDLVVECPVETTIKDLWERADPSVRAGNDVERAIHACIVLQYVECPEQIRPVHRDACNPGGGGCEPSRIRETTRLLLVQPCEIRKDPPEEEPPILLAADPNALCTNPYPGPRCTDEHHGVYLGCVWLTRTGALTNVLPCECRRHVILWPLLEYWFDLMGMTPPFPLDHAMARVARNHAELVLTGEASVSPLSRAPLRDVVAEVAARLPLTAITAESTISRSSSTDGTPPIDPTLLERMTVGALLDLGPEVVFGRLAGDKPTPALAAAVNKLFTEAEKVVRELAKKTARHGALRRTTLTDPKLKQSLLEVRGVTAAIVDAAVAAASRRA